MANIRNVNSLQVSALPDGGTRVLCDIIFNSRVTAEDVAQLAEAVNAAYDDQRAATLKRIEKERAAVLADLTEDGKALDVEAIAAEAAAEVDAERAAAKEALTRKAPEPVVDAEPVAEVVAEEVVP
jgi:hypothetical protein